MDLELNLGGPNRALVRKTYPLYTTLCFRLSKKSWKTLRKLPDMTLCSNLNMTTSYQTLSKAFDI